MAKKAMVNAAAAGIGSVPASRPVKTSAKKKTASPNASENAALPLVRAAGAGQDPQAQIAEIAYGYWAARGHQGGSQIEDWVQAEQEYLQGLR